ncbi:hypothetical protein [Nitrososphaera sp.]|uniref:hypothetical protein n=1 Tax=Nitrososphaera sp. TaxID=1971748 RepID=UPI0017DD2120|nr:hypothetical protein [Nitrososphaera sp.]NWG37563.1 hypothetical protein [Nitrososphaera sp.]
MSIDSRVWLAVDKTLDVLGPKVRRAILSELKEQHNIVLDETYCTSPEKVQTAFELLMHDSAATLMSIFQKYLQEYSAEKKS